MKKFYALLLSTLLLAGLQAQNSYTITSIPYNPDPFSGNTPTGITADDIWGSVITLPFSFCYYNSSYTQLVIGSNGMVTFTTSNANTYCVWPISAPLPNNAIPDATICTPWQDLIPSFLGASINYAVRGTAPYRRFVISYDQVPMFSCTGLLFSQQVILYETTNVIEFHILNKPLCPSWNGGFAIQGLQINSTLAFVVPGRNHPSTWTATNDAYRFSPVGACAGPAPVDSLRGKVFADLNNNCVQDLAESPIMNRGILANGGQFYAWTDANGEYEMGLAPGGYAVNEYMTGLFLASNCVPGGTHNVTLNTNVLNGIDFADSAISSCTDLNASIGAACLRRCDTAQIYVSYCNNGTITDSNATLQVVLDDSIVPYGASIPYTSGGPNTYNFNLGILIPGQCGSFWISCDIGCDTIGTIYALNATISGGQPVDCNVFNNTDISYEMLSGPFDPNTKHIAAQSFATRGYVETDRIDNNDSLLYRIDFQNVGTAPALDVVIRDVIDTNYLDINTIEALGATANYNWIVVGNELIFRFANINLPDSATNEPLSHGFVKYRIQQKPGNQPCTAIQNTARIFFDQEPAVVTNTTTNAIPAPAIDLGPDAVLCNGGSMTLSLPGNWATYAWSTGASTPTINVTNPGTYTLTVSDANGCISMDAINLQVASPTVNLGPDLPLCPGANLQISVPGNWASYQWSNGAITSTIPVGAAGSYGVTVTDANGCTASDILQVNQAAAPVVWLGNDTTVVSVCGIYAGAGFASYLWSVGATSPGINVTQSGPYWVIVTNADGCTASDTINVTVLATAVTLPQGYALTVSPVPASDRLQLRMEMPIEQCINLSITDLAGRSIWSKETQCSDRLALDIDLSAIANGTYLLHVAGDGLKVSRRIVVMR